MHTLTAQRAATHSAGAHPATSTHGTRAPHRLASPLSCPRHALAPRLHGRRSHSTCSTRRSGASRSSSSISSSSTSSPPRSRGLRTTEPRQRMRARSSGSSLFSTVRCTSRRHKPTEHPPTATPRPPTSYAPSPLPYLHGAQHGAHSTPCASESRVLLPLGRRRLLPLVLLACLSRHPLWTTGPDMRPRTRCPCLALARYACLPFLLPCPHPPRPHAHGR